MYNVVFMAFAKGSESKESVVRRYIGVAPVYIMGVNPTKKQLEEIYGTEIDKEPEYIGKTTINDDDDVEYRQIRLDFMVKTNTEKADGIELISKISFFLVDTPRINNAGDKVQMVNKYGEFFWITLAEAQTGVITTSKVIRSTDGMRKAFRGEEDLTEFLKNFLVIPGPSFMDRNTGEWKPIKDLSQAEAQLGSVENYFKGDLTELKDILGSQPTNQVKLCFGVKTTEENRQYQDVFLRKTLRLRVTDYSKLDEAIQSAKSNGAYPNTEFSIEPLKEYVVDATQFTQTSEASAPAVKKSWYQ